MAFILFSDSLFNTTYKLLHATDILHEKISDRSLLFSIMLFIIDELVKGINIREVVVRMRSTVSMMAWSVSGSDVTRLSSTVV